MKTIEQIKDELAVYQRNYNNIFESGGEEFREAHNQFYKDYMNLPVEQRRQFGTMILWEQISMLEWVLKDPYAESPTKGYLSDGEIPWEIAHKIEFYQGRNVHDVNATTYKLRNAYKKGDKESIEKHLKTLRTMINGL